jgi:hypothetical protein
MREVADINGIAQQPYDYTSAQPVMIRARLRGYLPFQSTGSIGASGLTVTAVWQRDTIVD